MRRKRPALPGVSAAGLLAHLIVVDADVGQRAAERPAGRAGRRADEGHEKDPADEHAPERAGKAPAPWGAEAD